MIERSQLIAKRKELLKEALKSPNLFELFVLASINLAGKESFSIIEVIDALLVQRFLRKNSQQQKEEFEQIVEYVSQFLVVLYSDEKEV